MKRLAISLLALGITTYAHIAPAGAKDTPEVLDFFQIAKELPRSPLIVDYDETWMITGPVSENGSKATKGENWKLLEGKLVFAYYQFNEGTSALQVQRQFEAKAKELGYDLKFSCVTEKGDCFIEDGAQPGVSLGLLLDKPKPMPPLDELKMSLVRNYFYTGGARYAYLTKGEAENITHVAVALSDTPAKGVMAITKSVITGTSASITGASSLLSELKAKKSISLHNLLFDVGSDILLPPSRDQIHEIAMMMREDPSIKLEIVGHTDSDGGKNYNLDLSKRRAASVVRALAEGFDIEKARLASTGKGMSEPIGSNDTTDGKAQNRRVELKLN